MPFTAEELSTASKASHDHHVRERPADQIASDKPYLNWLRKNQKYFPGGKQYITIPVRDGYYNNGQWYYGNQQVSYNQRDSLDQAQWQWRSLHDGLAMSEDFLAQNGIVMHDGPAKQNDKAERLQLVNLLKEQDEILDLGFDEFSDIQFHLDGTQDTDAPPGLDAFISLTPATGVIGGIDPSVKTYWRNYADATLTSTPTSGTILDGLHTAWRECIRNGGRPDKIFVGEDFEDAYRNFMMKTYGTLNYKGGSEIVVEGGTKKLAFMGVEMEWNPTFKTLDDTYSPGTPWVKRCYILNSRHYKLHSMTGHDRIPRKPPRVYDRYTIYKGITWKGVPVGNRRNAHAVLAIA